MPFPTDQTVLKDFIDRRHPDYDATLPHWTFCDETYKGGRDWFETNIFRYVKEGDTEFKDRLDRAYRFNHTREIVDLIQKYIFKPHVNRSTDAPEEVQTFWENVTLSGLNIDQFQRLVAAASSIFGLCWVFTDSTKNDTIQSKADEKNAKARVYSYIVTPPDVLDAGFDDNGGLLWIKTVERVRDDADPFNSSGDVEQRFRLWTKEDWAVFKIVTVGTAGKSEKRVVLEDFGVNELGVVPAFPVLHVIGESQFKAPGLIDDIVYLDRATANYLSNLDAIIQDQTFSQLAMPAQNLLPGGDAHDKLIEMGTKRIFTYDGESGTEPKYLSPDIKQAQIIVTVINKVINEIYHTVGMAGERTKEDNAVGIDNSSGVAKAYDFEKMNSLLVTKAQSLQNCENKLVEFVHLWNRKPIPTEEFVSYPQSFDVLSVFDEFTVAEKLMLIDAPKEVRQQQMRQVIDKMFPAIARDLKTAMLKGLEAWPVDPVERAGDLAQVTAAARPDPKLPGAKASKTASKNPQTKGRQGQVTSDTK